MTSNQWLVEGTAHRTRVQEKPVIHLLVDQGGERVMWCTSGKGRPDSPHGGRHCGDCAGLLVDAVAEGMADPDEHRNWLTDEQYQAAKADA